MEDACEDDVIESLSLLGEMLGFSPPLKAFELRHCEIIGDLTKKESVEIVFGSMCYLQKPFSLAHFNPSQSPNLQAF